MIEQHPAAIASLLRSAMAFVLIRVAKARPGKSQLDAIVGGYSNTRSVLPGEREFLVAQAKFIGLVDEDSAYCKSEQGLRAPAFAF